MLLVSRDEHGLVGSGHGFERLLGSPVVVHERPGDGVLPTVNEHELEQRGHGLVLVAAIVLYGELVHPRLVILRVGDEILNAPAPVDTGDHVGLERLEVLGHP